jgi:hypothetical protein
MDGIDFKVINDKQLLEMFDSLTTEAQSKVLKEGFKKASNIILTEAKQNFENVKKGKSKTNYSLLNKSFKSEPLKYQIGSKLGVQNYKALWLNSGTVERFYKTKKGLEKSTGKIKPTNFFYDAVNSKRDEAQSKVNDYIIESLDKVVKKYDL